MAERLAQGNAALALLANTLATVWGLFFLIQTFGPISGAHFNPAVSLVLCVKNQLSRNLLPWYMAAQIVGAVCGVWLSHAMFELPLIQTSTTQRSGSGLWIAECVATAGLILVVLRSPKDRAASLVAAYIGAAYWFTASTSFANPAAAIGRAWTDTYSGIAPAGVPAFVLAELAGAMLGLATASLFETATFDTTPDTKS
jgi:glycerol uptake facilitator-like aquaporin